MHTFGYSAKDLLTVSKLNVHILKSNPGSIFIKSSHRLIYHQNHWWSCKTQTLITLIIFMWYNWQKCLRMFNFSKKDCRFPTLLLKFWLINKHRSFSLRITSIYIIKREKSTELVFFLKETWGIGKQWVTAGDICKTGKKNNTVYVSYLNYYGSWYYLLC